MARGRAESIILDSSGGGGGGGGGGGEEKAEVLNRCLVFARMRPTKPGELDPKSGVYKLLDFQGEGKIVLDGEKTFDFDGTFGQDTNNTDVYRGIGMPTVDHVMKGFTSAILAYGQTGTGKSFTMSNFKPGMEGVIPLSVQYLLDRIEKDQTRTYTLEAQFVQIYRDNLSDLMAADQSGKVDVRWNQKEGVEILGCTYTKIETKGDFSAMYAEGDSRRVVRATLMNPESSRGHTALVIHISSKPKEGQSGGKRKGKLTFIDLAGYERFSKTGISGDPVCKDEAKTINASLLSLGHVVSALSAGEKHVPWRNSKLTRLLQDSIGGKSRTTIMIMLGPSSDHLHESTNSLDFGMRAMAVKVAAKVEENVDFETLAKRLKELLAQEQDKVNKLELNLTAKKMEIADATRRFRQDIERQRERHKEELTKLLEEGATPERIQALIKQQEVEQEVLSDQQECERSIMMEKHEEEEEELINDVEREHRVREVSLKSTGMAAVKERDGLIRAAVGWLQELQSGKSEAEIREDLEARAGSASPVHLEEDEDPGSPRGAIRAANAIDRRELDELKKKLEESEAKSKDQIERMKKAQLKLADMNKQLKKKLEGLESSGKDAAASSAAMSEKLEGELEAERIAKCAVQEERDGLQEEKKKQLEKIHQLEAGYTKSQSTNKDLKQKIEDLEQRIAEVGEEATRKDRERTAQREEQAQEAARKLDEMGETVAGLQSKVEELEGKVAELEANKAELEAALEKKTAELVAMTEKAAADAEAAAATLQVARGEKDRMKKEVAEMTQRVKKAEESFERRLLTQQKEIEDVQQRAATEKARARAEAEAAKASSAKCADQIQEATAAAAAMEAAHAQALRELKAEGEQALEDARKEAAGVREEKETLAKQLTEHEDKASDRAHDFDKERQEFADEREAWEREREELKTRCESLGQESSQQKADFEQRLEAAEATKREAAAEQEDRATTARAEAAAAHAAAQAKLSAEAEELRQKAEGEAAELKEKLTAAEAREAELREKLAGAEGDAEAERARGEELTQDGQGAKKALKELELAMSLEKGQLKGQISELEQQVVREKKLGREAEEQLAEAEEARDEAQKAIEEHKEKEAAFRDEVNVNFQKLREEHEESMKVAKAESEHTAEELRSELAETKTAAAKKAEELQGQLDSSKEECHSQTEMIQALEQCVQELEEELRSVKGQAAGAQDTLAEMRAKHQQQLAEKDQKRQEIRDQEKKRAEELELALEQQKRLQGQFAEERMRARGHFQYKSPTVNKLVKVSQMDLPKDAPQLLRPVDILAGLDPEEFKQALRYKIYLVGSEHSGKTSVGRCCTTEKTPTFRKAPQIETPSAGITSTPFTCKEATEKGFFGRGASFLITHYQVWDLPGDPRFISAMPSRFFAVKNSCFFLCYFINREFGAEKKRMEETLNMLVGCCSHKGESKLPIILFGTRKDLLPGSHDPSVVHAKVTEAVAWFNGLQIVKEHFRFLGAYACSPKDWTVQSETGKEGPTSFPSVMRHLSRQLHRMYPNTPPSLLAEESIGSGSSKQFEDWWEHAPERKAGGDHLQLAHRGVVSLTVTIDRMLRRECWLMGDHEFQWTIEEHFDPDVLKAMPDLPHKVKTALQDRGLLLPVNDARRDDGETVLIINIPVMAKLVSSLLQPFLYLTLVERWATERPGHLKEIFSRDGLFVDKVKRDEWDALYDGRMTQSLAGLVLHKANDSFQSDRALMLDFLESVNLGYPLPHEGKARDAEFFCPVAALRVMSPQLEHAFRQAFMHSGGHTAQVLPLRYIPWGIINHALSHVMKLMSEGAWLWSNAVAGELEGGWIYVTHCHERGFVVCTAKASSALEQLKGLVNAAAKFFGIEEIPDWTDVPSNDTLPVPPPQIVKLVREASDTATALDAMPISFLRGGDFPRSLDLELNPRAKGRSGSLQPTSPMTPTPKAGWASPNKKSPRGAEAGKVSNLAAKFSGAAGGGDAAPVARKQSGIPPPAETSAI
eukprot:Hpha_TRINITY_DN16092_c2_g2::TRINITY_DN16092_c2_g2_i11::g.117560::m.117560